MSNTRPEQIVDKNGKLTTVHKRIDDGGKSAERVGRVGAPASKTVGSKSPFVHTLGRIGWNGKDVVFEYEDGDSSFKTFPINAAVAGAIGDAIKSMVYGAKVGNSKSITPDVDVSVIDHQGEIGYSVRVGSTELEMRAKTAMDTATKLESIGEEKRQLDGWHSAHGIVSVVESPVGGGNSYATRLGTEDKNYAVSLGSGAMLTTYMFENAMDSQTLGTNERDEITFYREGDSDDINIQVELVDDIDISEYVESLDEEEYEEFKSKVEAEIQDINPNVQVSFDDPENVALLINSTYEDVEKENDGTSTFFTAKAVAQVEREWKDTENAVWEKFRDLTDV